MSSLYKHRLFSPVTGVFCKPVVFIREVRVEAVFRGKRWS